MKIPIMTRLYKVFAIAVLLISSMCSVSEDSDELTLEAVGFAADHGGKGGEIIRVTNLDSNGPGSLREALETKGPRIIVFEVGGVIDLNKNSLRISEPFVTIAGQTAPSPGITIIKGSMGISTHDVLVQHIRIRPGDAGEPKKSGWEVDGIATSGKDAYNIIVDHCSLSWATDENLSASGARLEGPEATSRRVTFSNCIIAEGLSNSTHSKGEHSKGSLIHDYCQEIAIIGNLYAHNVARNPYFKAHTTGVIVNNLIYNPKSRIIQLGFPESEWKETPREPKNCRISVIGNVLYHGTDTKRGLALVASKGDAYMEDNLAFTQDGNSGPLVSGDVNILDKTPVWPEGLHPLPADEVAEYVLKNAGARPSDRDETDLRIIKDFMEKGGRIIDSQDEVEGYPKVEMTSRKLDVPTDNVEEWLAKMAMEVE
jgi:pectate lyase